MTAHIIVITNQKGGCGKTTLAINVAGMLGKKHKVLLVDGDFQGSATRWASSASDTHPFPAAIMGMANVRDKAHREIKKYVDDYDFIIVDCPPAIDNNFTASVLLIADLVLIPVIPSPTDLWSVMGVQELINKVMIINENMQVRFVANMCQSNVGLSKEALKLLENFDFPKTKTDIYQRTVYRQSAVLGQCVDDLSNVKAKQEIQQLINEIMRMLKQ